MKIKVGDLTWWFLKVAPKNRELSGWHVVKEKDFSCLEYGEKVLKKESLKSELLLLLLGNR